MLLANVRNYDIYKIVITSRYIEYTHRVNNNKESKSKIIVNKSKQTIVGSFA